MRSIQIYYPRNLNVNKWAQQHEQGSVPDEWPYGLHQIPGSITATCARLPRPGSKVSRSSTKHSLVIDAAIAWEEDTALRMLLHSKANVKIAGVIWATDRFANRLPQMKDRLIRQALRRFQMLWVLSPAQVPYLKSWLGNNHPPIEVLTFGIDDEFFKPAAQPASPMLFSLGADRDRDMKTLYAAFEIVASTRPEVRLVVQTESPLTTPDGVTKISRVDHPALRSLYQSATAVVIATKKNLHVSGMTAALESMACGRPIVITETPGMDHYVEHNKNGLFAPTQDAAALASAAIQLIDDASLANRLGAAGRASIEECYNTRLMALRLGELVEKITS